MLGVVLGVGLAALTYLSVAERMKVHKRTHQRSEELPVEPRSSALSQALVELVATAGGIYLALILLRNFLKVEIPESIAVFGVKVEPMAGLALLLSLVQPYFAQILQRNS